MVGKVEKKSEGWSEDYTAAVLVNVRKMNKAMNEQRNE